MEIDEIIYQQKRCAEGQCFGCPFIEYDPCQERFLAEVVKELQARQMRVDRLENELRLARAERDTVTGRMVDLETIVAQQRERASTAEDFIANDARVLDCVRDCKNCWKTQLVTPRWIPVTERLPELIPCNAGTAYSEAVIVWTDNRKAMIAVWDGVDWLCAMGYWDAWGETITHWMPLPEPPKEV